MINFHFIIATSLFIFGLNFATDYDDGENFKQNGHYNVLWKLKFYSLRYIGEFWTRPLLSCPVCMASFWTTINYIVWQLYVANQLISWHNLVQLLMSIMVVAGLNRILKGFI
jgi:hypothetical protein